MPDTQTKSQLKFESTLRQWTALSYLLSDEDCEVLYGGAKGGGKSHLGCVWVFMWCLEIIKRLNLQPSDKPLPVGFMGRKIAKTFKETTLDTWKRVIPCDRYIIKGNPAEIIIDGCVKIYTGGLDNTESVNKFNSAEFFFFFIDQAEETIQDDIAVLRGALRMKVDGKRVPYKGLFTANPAQCWLKSSFLTSTKPNRHFVQALPTDNPHLPANYVETLNDAFGFHPELLAAYLYGNWDSMVAANQVIRPQWLMSSKVKRPQWDRPRRFLVCDTARFGDDESVIYLMEETSIVEHRILPYNTTTQLSFELARFSRDEDNIPVVIESTGADLGAGVADELRQLGIEVHIYTPQGEAFEKEKFFNQRAEAWWTAAKMLASGDVKLLASYDEEFMTKLETQLCAPTYEFRGQRILIETKDDIKQRLGCSPDRADTFVIALWALRNLPLQSGTTLGASSRYTPQRIRRMAI